MEQNTSSSAAAVSTVEEEACLVPVGHFWYMSHVYKEEIKRIEKVNGVKIMTELKVTFEPITPNGDRHEALSDFTNLTQKCLGESNGSDVLLKYVDPDAWSDTMKIIQKNENVLVTLSSEAMTICGPSKSQEAISKSINETQKINTSNSVGESEWACGDTSLEIDMNIKDLLVDAGLTVDKDHWKLMAASYDDHLAKIKSKFGVDFKVSESGVSEGKVDIKACYKRPGGHASMESHAVRALLRLSQKIKTSPMGFTQLQGASGFSGSPKNLSNDYKSEGASSKPAFNGRLEYSKYNDEAPTGKGATGDNEHEKCCICMDTFTNKKQLKCKHEFCDECLKQSEKSMGLICPVCKDVYGVIEGDQPDGNMSWRTSFTSLPGFPKCGTIEITYYIPGGIQTVNSLILMFEEMLVFISYMAVNSVSFYLSF